MSIIGFKEANCKNCYKCIRSCSVKSIAFKNEQAEILEKDCILCGHCFLVCPQNAKYIDSDLEKVKGYIKNGEKVFATLAPSFVSTFEGANLGKMSAALKKLGFTGVEETSIGAAQVSAEFGALMDEQKMENIITTCCPTLVMLVEKYYPELTKYLAPVVSPMMAHAKMMKEIYGNRIKVVFIGPCISKKAECADVTNDNVLNGVLMFDELFEWLEEEGIDLNEMDKDGKEMQATINRMYPVPGGILRTIAKESRQKYKCVAIDGIERCKEILDSLKSGELQGYFLEMNACAGGCINGPGIRNHNMPFLSAKDAVVKSVKNRTLKAAPMSENVKVNFRTKYFDRSDNKKMPSEEQLQEIYRKMGKTSPSKFLNCGGCGYPTCKDKAIAVFQGKADIRMCLPYMREKAESISNIVIDNTPNAIVILDHELNIVEYNPEAARLFDLNSDNYIGMPVFMAIPCSDVVLAQQSGEDIIDKKVFYGEQNMTAIQSIIHIKENNMYMLLIKDITEEEKKEQQEEEMRNETVSLAQKVIDKQMRVAQEIASLLGETTAETKTALNKLKKSIMREEDGK